MAFKMLNPYQVEIDGVVFGSQPELECQRCGWEGMEDELEEGQCPSCGGTADFVKWTPDEDDEFDSEDIAPYYVLGAIVDALTGNYEEFKDGFEDGEPAF